MVVVVVGVSLVSIIEEIVRVFPTSAKQTCGHGKMWRFLREEACFKRNHFVATSNPSIQSSQHPALILRV